MSETNRPSHTAWTWGPNFEPVPRACHCERNEQHADGAAQWGDADVRPTDRGWEISDEAAAEVLRMSKDS